MPGYVASKVRELEQAEEQQEARENLLGLMRSEHAAYVFKDSPERSAEQDAWAHFSVEEWAEKDYRRFARQHPGMNDVRLLERYQKGREQEAVSARIEANAVTPRKERSLGLEMLP